jgi:teichuronic acid biosynthesis glycosyltransferase TuaG
MWAGSCLITVKPATKGLLIMNRPLAKSFGDGRVAKHPGVLRSRHNPGLRLVRQQPGNQGLVTANDMVSVIMPAYNSEKYIEESIVSVLNQSYKNLELLVTDDCSSDGTQRLVEELAKRDRRIRYFRLTENSGAAVARNNSLKHAKGRYIAFLDADDVWLENKLELQLTFMKANDSAFSFTGYSIYYGNGRFEDKVIDSKTLDKIARNDLLKKTCTVGCSTVILDKAKLPKIEMANIRTGQDYALWLRLLRESGQVAHNYKKRLTGYRVLQGSISRNKFKKAKRQWQIYREIENFGLLSSLYFMFFYARNAVFRR